MLGLCSVGQPIAVGFHQATFSFLVGGTTAAASAHGGLAFVACDQTIAVLFASVGLPLGILQFPSGCQSCGACARV